MEGKDGKTERATSKKRGEQREQGNLAFSQEVVSMTVLLMGVIAIRLWAPSIMERMDFLFKEVMRFPTVGHWNMEMIQGVFMKATLFVIVLLGPIFGGIALGSFVSSFAQTGPYFSTKTLLWRWNVINPVSGFKSLFSPQSLINAGLSIVKIALIACVLYTVTRNRVMEVTGLSSYSVGGFMQWTFLLVYRMLLSVLLLYLVLAVADWAWQKYKHERDMMMSKQEVKEEAKNQEPSPLIKRAQRKKMREFTLMHMMAAVPKATVVVTNPTHVAVALEYDPEKMDAPKVVAKGLRLVAQRIKAIAAEHNIPIVEKPALARMLYKEVEPGKEIPSRYFEAVAEVLAYLHRLGRRIVNLPAAAPAAAL